MNRRVMSVVFAASLAACSHGASDLPPAASPDFNQFAIAAATPALSVKLNGANLRFVTGTQSAGFGFAGLLPQGVKLTVLNTKATYKYALTTTSTAVAIAAGAAGQYYVTPKAEVAKILLKASATPSAGGKALAVTFSLQIAPMVYVTSYPGSGGGTLGVYAPWSTKPIAQVTEHAPNSATIDGKGNVWLANDSTVEEYTAGLAKHVRTISGLTKATFVAVDALGNAYVVNNYTVTEYGPNSGLTPVRVLGKSQGISSAESVAVDTLNDLYIADFYTGVQVYAPGKSTTALRTLSTGVSMPRIVTVSGSYVYVANNSPNTNIPRFPVGSTTPNGTFGTSSGIPGPSYLTVDNKGHVFAAIANVGTTVYEYTAFASPSRQLQPTGGGNPTGLATDPLGNIYVANGGANSIDVFAPGTSTTPSYSIRGAYIQIYTPSSVAVWP